MVTYGRSTTSTEDRRSIGEGALVLADNELSSESGRSHDSIRSESGNSSIEDKRHCEEVKQVGLEVIKIEFGERKDIGDIGHLWVEMIFEMLPNERPKLDWWYKIARSSYDSGVYNFVVARDKGKIVGFLDYFIFPEPSTGKYHGIGQHLFLKKEYRNRWKVARRMFDMVVNDLEEYGVENIEFFAMYNDKDKWARRGFKPYRVMMRKNHV